MITGERNIYIYIFSSLAELDSKPYGSDKPDFGVTVVDLSSQADSCCVGR